MRFESQKKKKELREKFKRIRNALPQSYRQIASQKIAKKIFELTGFKKAKTIALYWKFGSEVSTRQIFKKIIAEGKTAALPRMDPSSSVLHFHKVTDPKKDLMMSPYRVFQPRSGSATVPLKKIDLIFVPGIVFDRRGYRLGYGKGFYDRLLRKKNSNSLTVGLTYEKTFVPTLPYHHRDVSVECVISEKRVRWIGGEALSSFRIK